MQLSLDATSLDATPHWWQDKVKESHAKTCMSIYICMSQEPYVLLQSLSFRSTHGMARIVPGIESEFRQ